MEEEGTALHSESEKFEDPVKHRPFGEDLRMIHRNLAFAEKACPWDVSSGGIVAESGGKNCSDTSRGKFPVGQLQ